MKKGRKKREYRKNLINDLEKLLKEVKSASEVKRIQCIYFKVKFKFSYDEIAKLVGYSKGHVRKIQSDFWKNEETLLKKATGGRIRENMTIEEESELIAGFKEEAGKGNIVEVSRIHEAYEKKLGRKVYRSVIYDLLDRQNWRRIMPRPKHQKNNKEKMEIFKKGRLPSNNQESRR